MDTAALFAELAVADWILSDAAAMDEIAPPPPKFWLTRSCTFRSLWHWSFPVIWPSSPSPPGAPTINANAMCFCFVDLVALTTTEVLTKPFLLTSALIVMGVLIVLILLFGESTHHISFRRADLILRTAVRRMTAWTASSMFIRYRRGASAHGILVTRIKKMN
ncbi:hypothetical protein HPB50_020419 [Hyalomma asiaticum]|uniref:Uncharacterized protein n=2 Tax=Hyalomma asiaticum TaxID=266040 RepID=A0ACB7TLG7_HYAAI|nr:hypothetical protein HPB50_020418 [Hyalomma asiaticum]KAH6947641.1 hypothetical protein HPB50_020419 [Hyalomma asiaticum]